ncbi:MAG: hypothetical protein ABJA81_03630, partial [Nocardioidaceae bacterium]
RVVARLDERYVIGGMGAVEGEWTVIGQIESVLAEDEHVSAIRIIRDVPPTPKETETIEEALNHFVEPSLAMGVEVLPGDISIQYPAVIVHPIAIYR